MLINNLSQIGIGCHRIQGGIEKTNSKEILFESLDKGVTYFDTAPRYGDSEIILGEYLSSQKNIAISSKVGLNPIYESQFKKDLNILKKKIRNKLFREYYFKKNQKKYFSQQHELKEKMKNLVPTRNLSEKQIRQSLELSLKNLRRDYLDIYFLHEPDQFINKEEISSIFEKLKNEGKILNFGLGYHRFTCDQDSFNENDIVLSMFKKDYLLPEIENNQTNIIHGLMSYYKFAHHNLDLSIDEYIKFILDKNPTKSFLVSPSNKSQLDNINLI